MPQKPVIAIIGNGHAGLAMALACAKHLHNQANVTLLGKPNKNLDQRATALNGASLNFLHEVIGSQTLSAHGQPITDIVISEGAPDDDFKPALLNITHTDETTPAPLMIANGLLSQLLDQAVQEAPITTHDTHVISLAAQGSQKQYKLNLDTGESLYADLLIVADGSASRTRESLSLQLPLHAYNQIALTGSLSTEQPHNGLAVQNFFPTGPLAFLPMRSEGEQNRASYVWSLTRMEAHKALELDLKSFERLLQQAIGYRFGKISVLEKPQHHPLAVGMARQWIAPQAALIGDAAHRIHPLAGQGLNLGLADAKALLTAMINGLKIGLTLNHPEILASYQAARRPETLKTLLACDAIYRSFRLDNEITKIARRFVVQGIEKSPSLKQSLLAKANGF